MTQNRKKRPAARQGGGNSRKKIGWQKKQEKWGVQKIVLLCVIAALIIAAGVFLQKTLMPAVRGDVAVASTVHLNEFVSDNHYAHVTDSGEVPDYIEIVNSGSEAVELHQYALMLDVDVNRMFTFPKYALQPGQHLLVYADGLVNGDSHGDFSAPFKLAPSGGQTVSLLNPQGQVIDSVALPELDADAAYVRNADGSWAIGRATPGEDNESASVGASAGVQLEKGDVELSEAMIRNSLYFADELGKYHDYVELRNTTSHDVNLSGWFLSDSGDDLKRWAFPDVNLPAGGSIAVHCSGEDRKDNTAHLHTDFKIGAGESLYLSRPDGHTVSMVSLPELESDQAYSLVDGEWTVNLAPTPGLSNTAESAAMIHSVTVGDKSGSLQISEIMASATEQEYDWIELYNGSNQSIDLSGFGLSDNSARPRRWQFPQGTSIQPGQYMGIYLSGTSDAMLSGYLNADFSLAAAGGYTVTLSTPQGDILDAIYLPQQYSGVSYGRIPGQSGAFFMEQATPGTPNGGSAYRERADKARVSVEGGLYTFGQNFTVELSAPAGSRIYYTLDASSPTEYSSLYTGPITINSTTILRTRVYRDGCMPSFIDTQSYLYDVPQDAGVYVISLVSDQDNFTGSDGILTNYMDEIEIEASFELFTDSGERVLGQGCGLSLHGQDSRKASVKTFNVIGRGEYDETKRFSYPIFADRDYEQYQSFLLRSSGEDYNMSFMRDTMLSTLMEDTSVLYQEYEVAVVYMNGAYYTLTYIRERVNAHAICQFEGWEGMEKNIDLIKGNSSVMQGSNESFERLLEYVKENDMSTQEAYDYLDSCIDIQNYIEYMSLQIFTANTDTLNVKRYRNPLADGKWRWILYDQDWAFYKDNNSIKDWLRSGGTGASRRTDNTLFIGCMKNPTFREQFLTYFGERMATTFSPQNIMATIEAQQARIAAPLEDYKAAWGYTLEGGTKKFLNFAKTRSDKLVNEYFRETFDFSDAQMEKYFGEAMRKIEEFKQQSGQ